jgi:hypothetical protein
MRRALQGMVAVALLALGGVVVPGALADTPITVCTGTIYGPTPIGSVTVPSGNTCDLQGITVKGNVNVDPGGRLVIGGTSTVKGSISSQRAGSDTTTDPMGNGQSFSVVICNTHVTGTVTITQATDRVVVGGGPCGGNALDDAVTLNGNQAGVELVGNAPEAVAGACYIENPIPTGLGVTCRIKGTVNVNNNNGTVNPPYTGESAAVGYNQVGDNLNCKGNVNGVTDISSSSDSNTAGGTKTGQCAQLGP